MARCCQPSSPPLLLSLLLFSAVAVSRAQYPEDFGLERTSNPVSISRLEVMCGKDHLTVQLAFTAPFRGIVFSKGQYGQPNCMYVEPNIGGTQYEFQIHYDGCGTKPDMGGKFYENTIIVQYDPDLIEVWDEAKRLRCEWYNDYEKTASKPPMKIADLEVVELNFRGDNVDCWMEIQDGKGPWASPVTGIVPLGSTLTMVVAINDQAGEFDMRVTSCEASDGSSRPIYLSDQHGCILRPKMISNFMKLRNNDGRATVLTYAHFHAFKFPDSMAVHLRCKVEICRYGCPDHCQKPIAGNPIGDYSGQALPLQDNNAYAFASEVDPKYAAPPEEIVSRNPGEKQEIQPPRSRHVSGGSPQSLDEMAMKNQYRKSPLIIPDERSAQKQDSGRIEMHPWGPRNLRRRREVVNRHVRSSNIGVSTNYQVISEADLEFTPAMDDSVTVFKGHPEDMVYGVCLPAPGFSALFVLVAMCTVISVLVAGFMCHHRQLQKDTTESPATPHPHHQMFSMVQFLRGHLPGYSQ
ncbi:uncharacterized protein LOC123502374 [Portunus trituberculatus]|uniref:uncharacterized protein LOC123502374 n=1 Tax=Portunus trituberculatus TaxID=210409 RepID=UPI001E1D2109|nr:uncharacterized protein LOC123502374 [Portunus trituberculatus]XP_045107485.1 uncharacterized protein LOC123502374 [Portunus trituberculatus]